MSGKGQAPVEHVTPAGGNVFEDIGFPRAEARILKIQSMLVLTASRFIEERGLTQAKAAELMGVSPERISDLLGGRVDALTIDALIKMLTRAGVPVEVRVAGLTA